jgi:hypothetical protein
MTTNSSIPISALPANAYSDWLTIGQATLQSPLDRLKASDSLRRHLRAFETALANEARANGATWDDIARALSITKQAAHARFGPSETPTFVTMVTGVVQPERNAVWYGLDSDTPSERNYAHSREECAAAYQLARARAEARAHSLGPSVLVNDGGIDRGSGAFWDLYIGD